mmetsp:Transcript_133390/g.414805  ORF Transcript_133390/g.414805 Transcript_133390/m.414805 type:complete len:189 (-) Transcript_133390:11-577(-)
MAAVGASAWELPLPADGDVGLKAHNLWEGWGRYYDSIPLGPGQEMRLAPQEDPNPEEVGFAYPLPPVEYAYRNERKHPPPTEEAMRTEMFKLVHHSLKVKTLPRSHVLAVVYNHVSVNKRDGPGWQRAFIQAGGISSLFEAWREPTRTPDEDTLSDKYWVMAILGCMMGTCQESRVTLIGKGAVELVL